MATKSKTCRRCKKKTNLYSSTRNVCKPCRVEIRRLSITRSPEAFIRCSFLQLKNLRKHKAPDIEWTLTFEQAMKLFSKQKGRCALTQHPMTWQRASDQQNPYNISIDRINSSGPYSLGNVHLVCKRVNMIRHTLNINDFVILCHQVAEHNPL